MGNWQNWLIYLVDIIIAWSVFQTWIWLMRKRYRKMIAPSEKHPHGQMVCEWWPESGRRAHRLLPIEPNGFEVRAPNKKHKCQRYFFNKQAQYSTQWPLDSFFQALGISVDAPIVSWAMNNPEPINPHSDGKPFVTAQMLASIANEDFMAMGSQYVAEMEAMQEELNKANTQRLPKNVFYIAVAILGLLTIAAGAFGYLIYMGLTTGGWI